VGLLTSCQRDNFRANELCGLWSRSRGFLQPTSPVLVRVHAGTMREGYSQLSLYAHRPARDHVARIDQFALTVSDPSH
jgi:hypothetical protein